MVTVAVAVLPVAAFEEYLGGGKAPLNEHYIDDDPWKESEAVLPPYPVDDNLLPVAIDTANRSYRFLIDEKALSIGEDRIIRYTLVAETRSGGRNVFYEGLNCTTLEYKRYAYGTSQGEFRRMRQPKWKPIMREGSGRFRRDLYDFYFCKRGRTFDNEKSIIQNIRYPKNGGASDIR
ncbi:hypothetical protein BOW53_06960 [Solemya pervernicosa gill symbiont]|uniref:CNP1-like uncharacterized domain-containing protein n=2 Tax=Gammaproteobacteria incertae sedis TaxID=118884 RepID=A0A1T2L6F3_9GAMM|nr:CNP1-like family protein [Candidatus Reidiella endopervernicosa]OOZ40661.1 hypothetical protein BOW53_06960 [Solemya pervernicosa gill symbiont]QKQ27416.1 CNP1-like family protein [Candidatus Reidiella endopervernicosa]